MASVLPGLRRAPPGEEGVAGFSVSHQWIFSPLQRAVCLDGLLRVGSAALHAAGTIASPSHPFAHRAALAQALAQALHTLGSIVSVPSSPGTVTASVAYLAYLAIAARHDLAFASECLARAMPSHLVYAVVAVQASAVGERLATRSRTRRPMIDPLGAHRVSFLKLAHIVESGRRAAVRSLRSAGRDRYSVETRRRVQRRDPVLCSC